jgi:hypothetical protein
MRFDEWPESKQPTGMPPEDGEHEGMVLKSAETTKKYLQTDRNPTGACLAIELDIAGYQFETVIPAWLVYTICDLAESAGMPRPEKGQYWDESVLIGRTVRVKTVQKVSGKGTFYVQVEKFLPRPGSAPAAAPQPKATKPAAKQLPDNDDIPF